MITYYVLNTIFVHRGNYASYCILANMPYIAKWMRNSDPVKITPNQLSATNKMEPKCVTLGAQLPTAKAPN